MLVLLLSSLGELEAICSILLTVGLHCFVVRQTVALGLLIQHIDIVGLTFKSDQVLQRFAESLNRFNPLRYADDLVVNQIDVCPAPCRLGQTSTLRASLARPHQSTQRQAHQTVRPLSAGRA